MVRLDWRAFFLTLFLLSAGFAQDLRSLYDSSFDFSSLQSFDFKITQPMIPLETRDYMADRLIRDRIEKELRKHYRRISSEIPSFLVAYYPGFDHRTDVREISYGRPRHWGEDVWLRDYPSSTLVVDFIDARTNQLIWRSVCEKTLGIGIGAERLEQQIRRLVADFVAVASSPG